MNDQLDKLPDLAAEAGRLREELGRLDQLSERFGATISRAFASAIADGRKFEDVLKGLALSLSRQALTAALNPLVNALPLGGSSARAPTVNINVTTPDAEGFRRSHSQIAAAMLRSLERGSRNL